MNKEAMGQLQSRLDERDLLLFGEPYADSQYDGGIRKFRDLDWKRLNGLINKGILDLNRKLDQSPSFTKIYNYLSDHHLTKCFGYVCSPEEMETEDLVIIEGIDYNGYVTMRMLIDFVDMFRDAEEFAAGVRRLHCRYV